MSTIGPIVPPQPTDNPDPSTDQPISNSYSPEQEMDDKLAWLQKNKQSVGQLLSDLDDQSKGLSKGVAMVAKGIGWVISQVDQWMLEYEGTWYSAKLDVFKKVLPDSELYHGDVFATAFAALQDMIGGLSAAGGSFGSSTLAEVAQILMEAIVQPFTLVGSAADPTQIGSGLANQQYLLSQSLALAVAEWFIDSAANETGMGMLKTLQPIMFMISNAVNPYNAVRMAMEYSYRFLVQQPLNRDMNHAYPIKDLGLSALAKLYIRQEITEDVYLSRCLDSGLNNTQAQQLLLEAAKLLSESDVAKLHQVGIMSDDDVLQYLAQQGYQPGDAAAKLYLLNHARYFTIQDRVGTEAVTAWKHGYIDQNRLEAILQQMGYSADEIQLLEIEGEFTKQTTDSKTLSYTQVKDAFKANILGIDYVMTYLSDAGYSPDDVQRLIYLDFAEAIKTQEQQDELLARLRVEADNATIQATEAQSKNETDLAAAKTALAKALNEAAKNLGALQSVAGIAGLLG